MQKESDSLPFEILRKILSSLKHRSGVEMRIINLLEFQLRLKKPVLVDGILCLNI